MLSRSEAQLHDGVRRGAGVLEVDMQAMRSIPEESGRLAHHARLADAALRDHEEVIPREDAFDQALHFAIAVEEQVTAHPRPHLPNQLLSLHHRSDFMERLAK
ncbi:MAG: hypothetical protein H6739_30630 [Alphaproteobacteria bacterium]|nr:hypothetical protein [Alphaproteobacteria bacterium]